VIVITDPRCTDYHSPGHPERPARVSESVARLQTQNELEIDWREPATVETGALLRAHTAAHLQRVGEPRANDFDADTPAHPNILDHALRSVGGALGALAAARQGRMAFSLLRPPGHHATRSRAMGFCYLNSIAIAVLEALATGTRRAAVFDFDVHHGNGTEAILAGIPGTFFASVHQYPCYPGTGTEDVSDNCFNYPVPPLYPREAYRKTLESALERILAMSPDLLAVSAGFDPYARDPIAQETLEAQDFEWLGERIRAAGLPVFCVLEGGYSKDLPGLILAFLKGLSGSGPVNDSRRRDVKSAL
jgi:acetoin utilization deacetylase AcuC-like enzyme